ncbi:MAG: MGMT family protein [Chloroflexi bacterium]|nr:MGMT family protein [Chloroflexota bacterium]
MTQGFCTFETAIGTGAVVWSEAGVLGIQLPEAAAARVAQRVRRRFPHAVSTAPPEFVLEAIDLMCALLQGQPADLSNVPLDMQRVPEFAQRVYHVARTIGPGETLSYGQIARRLGEPRMAREVGQALARNPFPIVVPCHRVVAANGKLGGFSATGGVATKQRLLEIEGANVAWQLQLGA